MFRAGILVHPSLIDRIRRRRVAVRDYIEILFMVGVVTFFGRVAPISYRVLGHLYLLVIVLMCVRVGRWPIMAAAVCSALAWNFVIIPPRLSFSVLDFDDALLLGTFFVVAVIAGELMARVRAKERDERNRELEATALFHLTQSFTEARSLDAAVAAALRQIDLLFQSKSALMLPDSTGKMTLHPASAFNPGKEEWAVADWVWTHQRQAGRFTDSFQSSKALYLPLLRAGLTLGTFAIEFPPDAAINTVEQKNLIETFAAQIGLLVEREQWRAAGEREKLLAESDRLRRTLLDSVSHELKTPLAVLRAASEGLDDLSAERRGALTAEIRTAIGRLDRLVANLLNQTRLESGAVKPQFTWCDVRDLIGAARKNLAAPLAGRPLKTEIPAEMPLLSADIPIMEQVLENLLLNAALHTPSGTPLVVSAGVVNDGRRAYVSVADKGPGIAPDMREHLFKKFGKGKTSAAGGVGLGLSIVRGFMLAQGGDVAVDENAGGGAKFTVFLPLVPQKSVPNE